MKTIAIAAVTAGGKTTIVNEIKRRLPNTLSLHFDDYTFEGEVEDFEKWVNNGADYNVWNLLPLESDIQKLQKNSSCEYLLLDYPFAYCHKQISKYIDLAFFIDTPLDIAMARRVLRDMKDASGEEIRQDLEAYLQHARPAYLQMLQDILPSSDFVIDGTKNLHDKVEEIIRIILEH